VRQAQIVAEELGIPPEDVQVRHGDTDRTPPDPVSTQGSWLAPHRSELSPGVRR
jgi:CO/xanthine dehydrogenase Mo-binding subunit